MVEQATTPIALAILGGAIHAAIFGAKAYFDGESIDLSKTALTVVLGGLIGLLFALGGYTPTEGEWVIILAAYVGFVAEIEAALKLLIRGYTGEARERFQQAGEEAGDATGQLAGQNRERLLGSLLGGAPRGTRSVDLNDLDDSHLSIDDSGGEYGQTPDPYSDGFEPHEGDAENGKRLSALFGWLHESPGQGGDEQPEAPGGASEAVITDGP